MSRTDRTIERAREAFLEALAGGYSVTHAAAVASIPRRTVYDWRDADLDFRSRWDEAVEAGTDIMEDEARRRAIEGYEKPIYNNGKLVGTVREYSDTLTVLLLKSRRPSKYRENVKTEISGPNEGPIKVEKSPDAIFLELVARLERIGRAKAGGDPKPGEVAGDGEA